MNMRNLFNAFLLISLLAFTNSYKIENNLRSLVEEIKLYILDDTYKKKISIPSDRLTLYHFTSGANAKYKVKSGSSVEVNQFGSVYPKNSSTYWYGNIGYSSPQEGKTPTSVQTKYTSGISTIEITENGSTKTVNFKVLNYGEEYAEKIMDEFIAKNVTKASSTLEKYKAITAFPAQYPYSPYYQGYTSMVIMEGGDCWASTNTIIHLCQKVGIKAHVRFAANDGGSGSGHRNAAALIDGKVYIGEAGYGYETPNRPHSVSEENTGFYTRTLDSKLKTAKLAQYDGFNENIKVPEKINNYTITEIGNSAFYYGEAYSGMKVKSIELPNTIEKIGDASFNSLSLIKSITIPKNVNYIGKRTFSNCPNLKELKIASGNKYFSLHQNVLYDYNKTKLLSFVAAKGTEYISLGKITEVDEYAFYYANNITTLILPGTVKRVGEGAFGDSTLKEIYFCGPQPEIGKFAFADINVTVYYPKNETWDTDSVNKDRARKVNFAQWDPPKDLFVEKMSSTLIWVIVIIVILVVLGVVGFIFYRRKSRNSDEIDSWKMNGKLVES